MPESGVMNEVANPAWQGWLERLANLNIDRARGAAPHKPLLLFLFVVLDLIENGQLEDGMLLKDGNLAFRFENDYTVLVKVERFDEAGGSDQLLKRRINQRIHLPMNQEVWPGREYLWWHRERHRF
jgi:hypothetical protein